MSGSSGWVIELNSFAHGLRVDRRPGMITAESRPDELIAISRRCLLTYWKADDDRGFVPRTPPNAGTLTPDEVVVRTPDGRALYRRTIMDEKIDRWFADA